MAIDPARDVARRTARAAEEVIESLDDDQRAITCWAWPSTEERQTWFYTPTDHGGVSLRELRAAQQRLVMQLLASALSSPGYVTSSLILGQENVLDGLEGFHVGFGRERGRDPLSYQLRFFGLPGDPSWSWRFGGHHLSINVTVENDRVVSTTPCFMGSDPARIPLLGPHLHRPLGGAEDLGRELARSLTEQQAFAVLPVPPVDIVGGNRPMLRDGDRPMTVPEPWRNRFEGEIRQQLEGLQREAEDSLGLTDGHLDDLAFSSTPKGIAGRDLSPAQRELLLDVLGCYVGRIHDDLADEQMARARESLDDLHFLWAGSTEPDHPHYYRVQGGDLFVEYDNVLRGGNHVHTVWRDLRTDFGGDPLAEHYTHGHPH